MTISNAWASLTADSDGYLLSLRGEFDGLAQRLLDATYDELTASTPADLTVDLTGVTFLASNALGFLAIVREHLRTTAHTVTLHGPDRATLRALQIMGFDRRFTITSADT